MLLSHIKEHRVTQLWLKSSLFILDYINNWPSVVSINFCDNKFSLLVAVINTMLCLYPSMLAECSFVLFTLRARVVFSNSSLLRISFWFFPATPALQFNKAGLLAWVHTCYFYLRVAGRVGPPPHLSLFTPGWGCAPLVASSVTVQGVSLPPSLHCSLLGCVAATLIPLLLGCVLLYSVLGVPLPLLLHTLYGVCCCHPCFTPGWTQQPLVPFTAKDCVFYLGLRS